MCRFVAYQGHAVLLADLLYRSRHSLVAQSAGAEEMSQTFNGDGFGVGWFSPEIDPWPCIVKAPGPAWSNLNARRMAAKIRSGNVFAHETARPPASLHYSIGERYVIDGEDGDMLGTESGAPGAVMVASEPLTRRKEDWRDVPPNHTLVVDVALAVSMAPIELGTPPAR